MPQHIPADSVGIVEPQTAVFDEPLELKSGRVLPKYELVYETYGTLNEDKSNAILICHALSGHHHAAGFHSEDDTKPGWWDACIGPGKAIDTNQFFVISLNNLGGCHGSTGPTSINPETDEPYGGDFPVLRVYDWVTSQARLADRLGIECFAAVVGGSLGGMQAMRWSIQYPERLKHCVIIASAPKLSAQNIAFNEVARNTIMKDPEFHDGHYLKHDTLPKTGLMQARMLAHLTYLSDDAMGEKFGRDLKTDEVSYEFVPEFQVESYLHYQGEKFSTTFDANTYLLMTKALDYFDPAQYYDNDLSKCLSQATCKFLVMSFTTDWRFSPERSEEIVDALIEADKDVTYACIESEKGHDAFLIPIPRYVKTFGAYMNRIAKEDI
ncbi:homoserine O-acetyltransferase [Bermanella marisrubri]|uniref:Homoserine O-succinyltransferase n=1 Tax=Bermanella marisrubri TaxID=207949 RepID=Q1N435_9GAMM|nr:homoserine O-acetyltransferase [Bermanella marisrubri]EAT13030.1 homoserine O-acetyltransferase [Oceanobacter sp. RED65] [Bermanella marisrubri]QIZ82845.1 homoserine O-acetyltransferase [Bermanella marisrubri]